MRGIGKIFDTKYGGLVFSLLSGCAYFTVIMSLISETGGRGTGFLGFLFFPAIVCGTALILLKLIKKLREEESFGKVNALVYLHILLAAVSIVFLIDMLK